MIPRDSGFSAARHAFQDRLPSHFGAQTSLKELFEELVWFVPETGVQL